MKKQIQIFYVSITALLKFIIWSLFLSKFISFIPLLPITYPLLNEFITKYLDFAQMVYIEVTDMFKEIANTGDKIIIDDMKGKLEQQKEELTALKIEIDSLKHNSFEETKEKVKYKIQKELLEDEMSKEKVPLRKVSNVISIVSLGFSIFKITLYIYNLYSGNIQQSGSFSEEDRENLKNILALVKHSTEVRPDPSNPIFEEILDLDQLGTVERETDHTD